VGALLNQMAYPHPIDLAAAKISVHRPAPNGVGGELKLPVAWEANTGRPTPETNHALLPGDRVFVMAPDFTPAAAQEVPLSALPLDAPAPAPEAASTSTDFQEWEMGLQLNMPIDVRRGMAAERRHQAAPLAPPATSLPLAPTPVAPTPTLTATAPAPGAPTIPVAPPALPAATRATPAPVAPPTSPQAPDQVVFNIVILEDRQGTLAEFKELHEHGFMMGDTTTTLGALRVFEKHKLIKRTADPRLICEVGREGRIELGSQPVDDLNPDNGVRVAVATRRLTPSIIVFSLSASVNGRLREVQTALDKNERQTAIMRVGPQRDGSDADDKPDRVAYVVVTPEWVQ
jgi:hypothetical protein